MKKTIFYPTVLVIFIFFLIPNISLAATQCETNFNGYCEKEGGSCKGEGKTNLGYYGCPNGYFCCGSQQAWSEKNFPNSGTGSGVSGGRHDSQGMTASGFGNPIGANTIEQVLERIMGYLKGIAGTLAVIFIIIGGIMYMISAGNKDMAEKAKKTVTLAMLGLAIVVAAPTFYREIMTILGGSTSGISGLSLQQIAMNILKLLLSIIGFLAIISMIIGSIWMFSAAGDEERYKLGKKTVAYSIIGIIIAVASLVIVKQIVILIGG